MPANNKERKKKKLKIKIKANATETRNGSLRKKPKTCFKEDEKEMKNSHKTKLQSHNRQKATNTWPGTAIHYDYTLVTNYCCV